MPTTDLSLPLPNGRSLTAAVAVPDGPGPHPGVLVLHEAFGLNGDIRRITSRFGDEGYVALAPDLYSGGNRLRCLSALLLGPFQQESLALVEAARRALADRDDTDERRIAVIGFCMGGGFALAFGARGGVKAASVNYGAVVKDRSKYEGVCPVVAGLRRQGQALHQAGRASRGAPRRPRRAPRRRRCMPTSATRS